MNKTKENLEFEYNEPSEEDKVLKERYVRWQQIRLKQFSYLTNLVIAINVGFTSLFVTQITNMSSIQNCWLIILFSLCLFGMVFSLIFGILVAFNRLSDFRNTEQLIKLKINRQIIQKSKDLSDTMDLNIQIALLTDKTARIGKKSWIFMNIQVWLFAMGFTSGIIFIVFQKLEIF